MKRLLLPLLAALALPTAVEANWFGKFNSRYEAKEACEKWKEKGVKNIEIEPDWTYSYDENGQLRYIDLPSVSKKVTYRSCKDEESTKQYLGFELKSGEKKLKKYFKY